MRRSAFSLTELLVVLLILGMLGGGLSLRSWARPSPEKEADRAMRWVLRALTLSNHTGRPFTLLLDERASKPLSLTWKDSGRIEAFPASPEFRFRLLRQGTFDNKSVYDPQWGTLTPAATIRISAPQDGGRHYLILSGYGRVRTNTDPPPGGVE